MTRHEIPTHLEVEDHLLGPLTTKDAMYLLVGAAAVYGVWTSAALPIALRSLLAGGAAAAAILFALVKLGGRPMDAWLCSGLAFTATAKRALWRPRPGTPTRRAPSDARWRALQ